MDYSSLFSGFGGGGGGGGVGPSSSASNTLSFGRVTDLGGNNERLLMFAGIGAVVLLAIVLLFKR